MPTPQPELVGREPELKAIESFLDGREHDGPTALVLEGEAGIGKTTLWREGLALASARSYRILVARPTSPELELPFAGLADLVHGTVGDVLPRLPAPQRQALEAALLLAEPDSSPPRPHTIAAAVLSYLRELSRLEPVLVAIDDVQWLDSSSRGALEFALRRIVDDRRIAFFYSWRPSADERLPLGAEGLRDDSVQLANVGPLSLGALHRVITTNLGHSLPRPVLARVHTVSGGNPFFALELARVAEQRRTPAADPELPLPASIVDTLHERLEALPADTRDTLLTVSVAGSPTLDVLEGAVGSDARSRLQPAIDSGMLVIDEGRARFSHPLLAATVYSEAWPSNRRACHAALAEVVTDPDDRVRHLALASEGPDAALATALEESARRLRLRGAPEAAATVVEQSWKATPPDDFENAWRRGLLASEYHLQSGDVDRFVEVVEGLLTTARTRDERSMAYLLLFDRAACRRDGAITARPCARRGGERAPTADRRVRLRDDGDRRRRSCRRRATRAGVASTRRGAR